MKENITINVVEMASILADIALFNEIADRDDIKNDENNMYINPKAKTLKYKEHLQINFNSKYDFYYDLLLKYKKN